ncbi:MAG: GNAT family N-acetyltransferase [Anaerolineales bacterium]|nr:GNAT family N-acetyltransferase [Anaerolineales bacterium]
MHNLPEYLETERLILRPYHAGDGAMYYASSLRNRRHLARYEARNALCSLKDEAHAERVVCEMAAAWEHREYFFLGMFRKQTNEWVGQIYIGPLGLEPPAFTIGYIADVANEGHGYVTEAVRTVTRFCFERLGAMRLSAECDDQNIRSYRVLERCGFIREGHLHHRKPGPDGRIGGTLYYGLMRSEWEASREGKARVFV